ncbi:hypothetical protein BWI17_15160 [Betaproteobacteria bacterium GR16-43]|nr:hypothetical protein BWI17_15160 [Betaproteobacteria bacterium GR16-43]
MNEYLIVKTVHVLSSAILFGTGIGTAFFGLATALGRDARTVAAVWRWVVRADLLFTTPAVILQPLTGFHLVQAAGFPLTSTWVVWGTVLYLVAGACWLPVLWIQVRMRGLAQAAAQSGAELPPAFWKLLRFWVGLGIPAFVALVAVFYLMVAKPA